MSVRENIKSFKNDNIRIITFLISLLLTGYHIFQYITTGNEICFLRIAIYAIISFVILLLGFKIMYLILILLALLTCYFNSFVNFTQFFVLLMACRMNRRSEKWLLAIYGINESIALMVQGKDISSLLIHMLTCVFFYLIYFFINRPKVLDLKPDEEEIIKQLAAGKMQKEIELYSKNVIKDKLDHAKDRNHIIDTNELITLYRQSHPQSH